ncbi:hypothetical protein FHG87_012398 [Trinorchestia longiramus]|nr:hypothetical protein FHG87_012398 [Trinorchestia longiramus]
MVSYKMLTVVVLVAVLASTNAQFNNNNDIEESGGYFSGLMENVSSLSGMDWQGMIRSVVESLMQYFVAPTTRRGGATSRAITDFESDLVVNFIEQSPTLSHYAKLAHSYIVAADRFLN